MAAITRGAALAMRCSSTNTCVIGIRSSFMSSGASIFTPFLISLRSFSQSTQHNAERKKMLKSTKSEIGRVKQKYMDHLAAQERAAEKRAARAKELDRADAESQAIRENIVAELKRKEAAALPLNPYRPQQTRSTLPEEIDQEIKQRDVNRRVAEILEDGRETIIYQAPRRRWHLGLASLVLTSTATLLIALLAVFIELNAQDSVDSLFNSAVYAVMLAMAAALLWQSWRRRSQYVQQITMCPKVFGHKHVYDLQVRGTSFVPFMTKTVTVPSWAVRTNRNARDCVAEPMRAQRDLREYYNAFRPFVWLEHTISGVWRELKLIIVASHGRQLTKLYLEEGSTAPFSVWNLDARGTFWQGPGGFDALVRVDPTANDNWFARVYRKNQD